MAYFEIYVNGSIVVSRKKNEYASFSQDALNYMGYIAQGIEFTLDAVIVNGSSVTLEQAVELCEALHEEWLEKKNKTHKRVMVSIGATNLPGTYHPIWVKR